MKYFFGVLMLVALTCAPVQQVRAGDPITLIIKAAIKKVIKALDLAVQRLQNVTIQLQNIQKRAENLLSKLKLDEIYEWSKKQKELFAGYYEELWKVKTAISYYKRIKDIVEAQVAVVNEYRRAVTTIGSSKAFTAQEVIFMLEVYTGILDESVRNVDQIAIIIESFATQMTDAKRLELIHRTAASIESNLNDLRAFTNENVMLGLQRVKSESEIQTLKGLYNLP